MELSQIDVAGLHGYASKPVTQNSAIGLIGYSTYQAGAKTKQTGLPKCFNDVCNARLWTKEACFAR